MSGWNIEWLRPEWLLGFIPLLLWLIVLVRRQNASSDWDSLVDRELQQHVIEQHQAKRQWAAYLLAFAWAFCLLLMAGPVWQQREVPVFQAEQAEVVVFDLSRSMRADDVLPNRLTRARFKLVDLLQQSEGRQTGLIAFSERPYVISPLTEDASTIEAFVPSLDPDIMPVQGSRPDLAMSRALELLEQAGVAQGHILLITDTQVNESDIDIARDIESRGHRLSVLGVGTAAGAPLRDANGQFLQRSNGAIVVPRLNLTGLRQLAEAGGGVAVRLAAGSQDLDLLETVRQSIAIQGSGESSAERQYWIEYAPWGVWVLLLFALGAFRRGVAT